MLMESQGFTAAAGAVNASASLSDKVIAARQQIGIRLIRLIYPLLSLFVYDPSDLLCFL